MNGDKIVIEIIPTQRLDNLAVLVRAIVYEKNVIQDVRETSALDNPQDIQNAVRRMSKHVLGAK